MDYVLADTHFYHSSIIDYCERPFSSIEEMNERIISNINEVIQPSDNLWHLGDWGGPEISFEQVITTRNRIKCKNILLIRGNHDKLICGNPALRLLFTKIWNYYEGEFLGHHFLFTHRPTDFIPSWENSLYEKLKKENPNLIALHGHTHNGHHLGPSNMCVECLQYKPILIEQVIRRFE